VVAFFCVCSRGSLFSFGIFEEGKKGGKVERAFSAAGLFSRLLRGLPLAR